MVQKKIIERVQAHYESHEMPFGKTYEWHPAYLALECECGEKATLSATNAINTCPRCSAELATFVDDLREREGYLPEELIHP
jgi:hypothetical protein